LPGARIVAIDLIGEYLDTLRAGAAAAGVADRVHAVRADMGRPPLREAGADLLWSEGAAYALGFQEALTAWRPLLRPGGAVAASELVWLSPDPPAPVAEFFRPAYPAIGDVETALQRAAAAGYAVMGHFLLPDAAWWADYYTPLEAKLPALRAAHAGDPVALDLIRMTAAEIDLRRRYPDAYGYLFVVARRPA
jgi:hypothetical protein